MRVLHVVTAFPRSADDVIAPWLVELLKRLRAAGYDIAVFTSAARRSDRVVAISSYTAAEVRELADIPIEVIPYTTSLPAPGAAPVARDGTGPVLFVGRLVERKGVANLVEALARLGPGGPRLEVIGDGPERPALEALARQLGLGDRATFRGKVPARELQECYARAAVCVLPSVTDARGDTEGLA